MFALPLVWAQTSNQSGAITGSVTDQSGGSVPNATVTLKSQSGSSIQKTTGGDGLYTFPLLPPGRYSLEFELTGFSKYVVNDVKVDITAVTQVNAMLQVGQTTSEVAVTATATQVNTTNSTLGNVLPGSTISALPLATRNFTNLLALNANTSSTLPQAATAGRASATIYVNGQRGTNNNLVINGVDANSLGSNNFSTVPIPAPDTIEEFRVQTSLYDAAAGKTSGGNINVITKSGGPQYHGEGYEYFRNEAMNANEWFFNKTGQKQPVLRQNQFGGNFGGPVPFLSKTYFFGSYQGTYQTNGVSSAITTVFPVLPAARTRANIERAFGLTPGSMDPVSLNLLNAPGQFGGFLIPSGVGAAPGQFGQLSFSRPLKYSEDQYNLNGDHDFGDKLRLGLRYFHADAVTLDPLGGEGAGNLGSGQTTPIQNHTASVNLTWSISSNLVNEARIGFNRIYTAQVAPDPARLSDVGMSRFNSSVYPGIPVLSTSDITPAFGGISTNNDQASYGNTLSYSDTLAWSLGKHTLRFGFEGRNYQINLFNNFASRGILSYNAFTDFLTGNIQQTFIGTGQTYRDFRAHDTAAFVQDDFKITPRLTLNLGVRYDYLSPSTDRRNRLGNFDPSRLDAQTLAIGGPGLLNGFVLPEAADFGTIKGTPGVSSSTFSTANNLNFAPRVGFAWDPFGDAKTSIRGGFGMYYVRISNQTLLQLITAAPFFQQSSLTNPGTPNSNPFPNLPLPSQFPIFPSFPTYNGLSATGAPVFTGGNLLALNPFQRNMRTPYAEQFNFSIQRQLPGNWTAEIGYAGSQGVRLLQSLQLNQALLANAANPVRGLTFNSARNANARVPVVGFSPAGRSTVTANGHSVYNAFISTLSRRMSSSFLQFSYTFSKSIDNNSGSTTQDLGNAGGNQLEPQLQRGLSNFDRPHRFVATYSYDLPGPSQGILRTLVGGWNISGYTTLQSSLPINFTCSCGGNNITGLTNSNINLFPNVNGPVTDIFKDSNWRAYTDAGTSVFRSGVLSVPPSYPSGTVLSGYNASAGPGSNAYVVGGPGSATNNLAQPFGNMGRNPNLRGPFQSQFDVSLMKTFHFGEKLGFQLRGDAYNLFNHPIFDLPNASVGSSQFGRVSATVTNARILNVSAKIVF